MPNEVLCHPTQGAATSLLSSSSPLRLAVQMCSATQGASTGLSIFVITAIPCHASVQCHTSRCHWSLYLRHPHCDVVQCSEAQCSAVQCGAVQCSAALDAPEALTYTYHAVLSYHITGAIMVSQSNDQLMQQKMEQLINVG